MENEFAQICVTGTGELAGAIALGVVTVASTVANFVGKDNLIGKVVNWLAINIKVEKKQ